MAAAKMRTLVQEYQNIHKEDPESSISMYYLRTLAKTHPKEVGVFKTGVKTLVNHNLLMDYLNNQNKEEDETPFNDYGTIRKVCE